jgi:OOP family OmpA-OmpF porin
MKKVLMFALTFMMAVVFTAWNAEAARPGGLPAISVDEKIIDCDCNLFPECCEQPAVVAPPAPAPKPAPVPPPPLKEKVTMSLNVEFDTDKAVVKDIYYNEIKKVADFMKEFPETNVTIEGHTDAIGSQEYNQDLSERRAKSVRQYLIDEFGMDGSRISAVGYGEDLPVDTNDTEDGRQKNRRVDAVMEAVRIIR